MNSSVRAKPKCHINKVRQPRNSVVNIKADLASHLEHSSKETLAGRQTWWPVQASMPQLCCLKLQAVNSETINWFYRAEEQRCLVWSSICWCVLW